MPNGSVTLSVYTENDIETCRDVLFYVAQVLGGFFIINREGKLELRKYGKDPVMKVEQRHRFSSSFSDFITRYTAVSSTNKQTQIAEYYALDPDNGLTMNLGGEPASAVWAGENQGDAFFMGGGFWHEGILELYSDGFYGCRRMAGLVYGRL